jgi:hypothetical protein
MWEMINFRISGLRTIQSELSGLLTLANANADHAATIPHGHKNPVLRDDEDHQRIIRESKDWATKTAELAEKGLAYLHCPHIEGAAKSLKWWSSGDDLDWSHLRAHVIALREAIDTELKQYFYYQYPKPKGYLFNNWKKDWDPIIAAFPSVEFDACRATDCYALGQEVASVFHCMRALEYGLKAIAADVGLTFDLQQWHNIIDQIESKITAERKTLAKGAPRNERLQFLSEAAKEFFYFKDGWRNYVSHNRANYDEHQALSVLTHVRSFMLHLASKLSEAP